MLRKIFALLVTIVCLTSCVGLPDSNDQRANAIAAGWHEKTASHRGYTLWYLTSAQKLGRTRWRVYIEGDGRAWQSKFRPSVNPTPLYAEGLALALADTSDNVVYLARPCQFISSANCTAADWTSGRFAPKLLAVYMDLFDSWRRAGATDFELVGYSGGGTMALLLAQQRHDIARVISVAGVLDTNEWTTQHNVSPLTASLNPADRQAKQAVNLVHICGDNDRTVPCTLFADELTRWQAKKIIAASEHHCCYAAAVQDFLRRQPITPLLPAPPPPQR